MQALIAQDRKRRTVLYRAATWAGEITWIKTTLAPYSQAQCRDALNIQDRRGRTLLDRLWPPSATELTSLYTTNRTDRSSTQIESEECIV